MKGERRSINSGKVLAQSLQLGLSATLYLMRERVTKETKHLYYGGQGCKGLLKIWNDARNNYTESKKNRQPNAIHLQKAEHSIRRSFNRFVFNTSVRYGNTEKKRMRRKEDRKYINILEDYLGAKLRDLAAERFPFPPPVKRISEDGIVQWVYPGSARNPEFVPRHTAPEQDFIDMIRSHGIELARQCLRYGVPIRDSKRYIDRLIERLIPFLEYVYTERRVGSSGFTHGATKELRGIVVEIRLYYGKRNGRPQSITGEILDSPELKTDALESQKDEDIDDQELVPEEFHEYDEQSSSQIEIEEKLGFDDFFELLANNCRTDIHPEWNVYVKTLKKLIKRKILTRKDTEYIYRILLEESRRVGIAFHDFIANANYTHRPFSLFAPIRHGDKMLSEPSEFLLVSETPVANGRGRIDLVLFRRKVIETIDDSRPVTVWEPCAVIDIKTKCAFNLDLYAVQTRSKKHIGRRVIELDYERRRLTSSEWEDVISAIPSEYEEQQLEKYEKHLLSDYQRIARADVSPPEKLVKAVLVMDSKDGWTLVRDKLQDLIKEVYDASIKGVLKGREYFQISKDEQRVHAGLIVFGDCQETDIKPLDRIQSFNPFQLSERRKDDRKFVLYLTVSGKGSSQESAAKIAAKWNGLEYIHQKVKGKHRDIVWLDFTGEYSDPALRSHRLRLETQPKSLQRFLKRRVSFIDFSQILTSFFLENGSLESVSNELRLLEQYKKPFIIVTGFDMIRGQIPAHSKSLHDEFIIQFISVVPESSTVVWFDRPVPLSQTSERFDTRCVAPFYAGNPWMYVVNEIVWNLPMSPPRFGSFVPPDDDVRLSVIEKPDSMDICPILITPLYKWGERFRPDKNREENITKQKVFYLRGVYLNNRQGHVRYYAQEDFGATLELVPHLLDSQPAKNLNEGVSIERLTLSVESKVSPNFLSRVSFTPFQLKGSKDEDGRVKRLEPLGKTNHPREYRITRFCINPSMISARPPHISLLKYEKKTKLEIVQKELSGIRRAAKVFRKIVKMDDEWNEFLDSLSNLTNPRKVRRLEYQGFNFLRNIRVFLETNDKTKHVWRTLREIRSWYPRGLNREQMDKMEELLPQFPDLFLITGTQLFLLLIAALKECGISEPSTGLVERLWKYMMPWQLVALGFTPYYHSQHRTGKSVLNRTRLLEQLINQVKSTTILIEKSEVSEVHFGRVIPVTADQAGSPVALWLMFQSRPGSHEMNAGLVPLVETGDSSVIDLLRNLPQERVYWGETNLVRLGALSRSVNTGNSVPIMIARHRDVRGIWFYEKDTWSPLGRIEYFTRKKEFVTLLRSFTLRLDSSLRSIKMNEIRNLPSDLDDNIKMAFETIDAVFRDCKSVRCRISIDEEERMFKLSFLDGNNEVSQLLVRKSVDVLDLLRRPDFECEPIVVDGKKLVWSRFNDITYEGDALVLKPWVIRKNPFSGTKLVLPPTADNILKATRKEGLRLKVIHDPHICPLRSEDLKTLKEKQFWNSEKIREYLQYIEGQPGQPDKLVNESIHRHGICWKIQFSSSVSIPKHIKILEKTKFSGPALATLLETGVISYQTGGEWVLYEFMIPESAELPREFRESIYLMRWRRDTAALPGQYILEEWKPDISLGIDKITFSLESHITGEKQTHFVHEQRGDQMHPEKLGELLERGMSKLVEREGLEEDERLGGLIQKMIEDVVELVGESRATTWVYEGLGWVTKGYFERVLEAIFSTSNGDRIDVQVTQGIHVYLDWVKFSGGVDSEVLDIDVSIILSQYGINEKVIKEVIKDVKNELEREGVRFYES